MELNDFEKLSSYAMERFLIDWFKAYDGLKTNSYINTERIFYNFQSVSIKEDIRQYKRVFKMIEEIKGAC